MLNGTICRDFFSNISDGYNNTELFSLNFPADVFLERKLVCKLVISHYIITLSTRYIFSAEKIIEDEGTNTSRTTIALARGPNTTFQTDFGDESSSLKYND